VLLSSTTLAASCRHLRKFKVLTVSKVNVYVNLSPPRAICPGPAARGFHGYTSYRYFLV
jgi:hypothetical protein